MSKSFIHGSLFIFGGLILGKILAMSNNILLARYLNADKYGLFLLGLSIFEFLQIPARHGTPSIIPKLIAEFRASKQLNKIYDTFSLSMGRCTLLSIFIGILTYFLSPYISKYIFHAPELNDILRALSFLLPFSVIIPIALSFYRGYKITRAKVLFGNILPNLLRILFFLILFYAGFELSAAYHAFIIATVLVFILIKLDLRKTFRIDFTMRLYDSELSPVLLKLSWPLMLQSFVWIIYTRIDRLFIGYYLQPREVGVYGAASAVAGLLSMIPQSFSFLSLPMFSKFSANNSLSDLKSTYKKITTLMFAIALPIFICLFFLSKDILILLYGVEYASGATALLIVGGGILSGCLVGPASDALIGFGKTKAPLISMTTGCVSNICLNVILIPTYGITGAAVATCISMLIARFTIVCFNYKYLKILPICISHFAWPVVCILLMPVFIVLKKMPLIHSAINIYLAGAIYLALNYIVLLYILRYTSFGKLWLYDLTFRSSA